MRRDVGGVVPGSFSARFLDETAAIVSRLDAGEIERMVAGLRAVRDGGGRLFVLGVGGSAGHASHAVNDFRKLCGFEAYAPTDNVSELTARINDEGWESSFVGWLKVSRLRAGDGVLVFSVGGGDRARNVSPNLVTALDHARAVSARIFAVVGRPDGHAARVAESCVVIAAGNPEHVTPHAEGLTAVVWHLMVSHPALKIAPTRWESLR
ncbi:MAG: SIS domain-containing protein [Dongiaceae bacterium]